MNARFSLFLKRMGVFLALLLPMFACLAGLASLLIRYGVFFMGFPDAGATAEAWLDVDGDGLRGPEEPPLEGVCIWAGTGPVPYDEPWLNRKCAADYGYGLSGTAGQWPADREGCCWLPFFAGAECNDVYIYAVPPPAYYATTPLVVNGCEAQFGFHQRGGGIWVDVSVPRPQEIIAAAERRRALETGLRVAAVIAVPLLVVAAVIAGAAFAAARLINLCA